MKKVIFVFLLMSFLSVSADVTVTFNVKVPHDSSTQNVYIVGNHASLGSWDPTKIRMKKTGKNNFQIKLPFPENTQIEYKYTQGNWDTVEKSSSGGEITNRTCSITSQSLKLEDTIEKWAHQSINVSKDTLTGNIKEHVIESKFLKRRSTFLVYLPPNYNVKQKYPVIFLLDGNNMFNAATAFGGTEWTADEALETLIKTKKIPPVIAVAVYNSSRRNDEYTFCYDTHHKCGGDADLFLKHLSDEIYPELVKNYNIQKGREHTAILGSSLGGLCALYAVYQRNEFFSSAGVVSPSIWWADKKILDHISHPPEKKIRIWMDIGTKEGNVKNGKISDAVINVRAAKKVIEKNNTGGIQLKYLEIKNAEHNEYFWSKRIKDTLYFLYH